MAKSFENINNLEEEVKNRMDERVQIFQATLNSMRVGLASVNLLDGISVDAYGSKMSIRDLANISIPEPRLLLIQPYDASVIPDIEKAIQVSDIGITPMNDGKLIHLPMPELNEERRKDMVKIIKSKEEGIKIELRAIRRDANELSKKAEKNNDITQDDLKLIMNEIQRITDEKIQKIINLAKDKTNEIFNI